MLNHFLSDRARSPEVLLGGLESLLGALSVVLECVLKQQMLGGCLLDIHSLMEPMFPSPWLSGLDTAPGLFKPITKSHPGGSVIGAGIGT